MATGKRPDWLRSGGALMLAATGASVVLLIGLWLSSRLEGPLLAPTLEMTAADLHLVVGTGERSATGLQVNAPGSKGIAMVQAAIRQLDAARYARASWQIDGRGAGQELRLVWAAAEDPRSTRERILTPEQVEGGSLDLTEETGWKGRIIAIGLVLKGTSAEPVLIRRLALHPGPASPAMVIRAIADAWAHSDGWSGRSINFDKTSAGGGLLSPVQMAALWVGIALVLYGLLNPPWKGARSPLPYALALLIGWVAVDVRWQWDLGQRLAQTRSLFSGLDEQERQLAGPDREFYPLLQDLRRHLTQPQARLLVVSAQPNTYLTNRIRYHLAPHNVYPDLTRLPGIRQTKPGDYLLLLGRLDEIRFDPDSKMLKSDRRSLPAKPVFSAPRLGALFQIEGGP